MFAGAMYNICRRMMGNDDDARDVLQDAFIHVFTKIHSLHNDDIFPAWIKKIVLNQCINALRKNKGVFQEVDEHLDIADYQESENEYAKIKAQQILSAMDELSEGCRTVANLYLFEGYDHKEIAEILSITVSTSKAQYSKAKSKLRDVLSKS